MESSAGIAKEQCDVIDIDNITKPRENYYLQEFILKWLKTHGNSSFNYIWNV